MYAGLQGQVKILTEIFVSIWIVDYVLSKAFLIFHVAFNLFEQLHSPIVFKDRNSVGAEDVSKVFFINTTQEKREKSTHHRQSCFEHDINSGEECG